MLGTVWLRKVLFQIFNTGRILIHFTKVEFFWEIVKRWFNERWFLSVSLSTSRDCQQTVLMFCFCTFHVKYRINRIKHWYIIFSAAMSGIISSIFYCYEITVIVHCMWLFVLFLDIKYTLADFLVFSLHLVNKLCCLFIWEQENLCWTVSSPKNLHLWLTFICKHTTHISDCN